jgi:hypothetical protein
LSGAREDDRSCRRAHFDPRYRRQSNAMTWALLLQMVLVLLWFFFSPFVTLGGDEMRSVLSTQFSGKPA